MLHVLFVWSVASLAASILLSLLTFWMYPRIMILNSRRAEVSSVELVSMTVVFNLFAVSYYFVGHYFQTVNFIYILWIPGLLFTASTIAAWMARRNAIGFGRGFLSLIFLCNFLACVPHAFLIVAS